SERLTRIDKLMHQHVDEKKIAGGVVLIARKGKIVYFKEFGMMDTDKPMQKDTIFRLASMSKPFTSAAVAILCEEGKLAMSSPISAYIPEFSSPKVITLTPEGTNPNYKLVPAKREITVRDLLSHEAGITYRFFADWFPDQKHKLMTKFYKEAGISDCLCLPDTATGDLVKKLATMPLFDNPGDSWVYGLAPEVSGYLVEVSSGMSLDKFMQEKIFKPLKMEDTYFYTPPEKQSRISPLWETDWQGHLKKLTKGPIQIGEFIFCPDDAYKTSGKYFSGGAGLHGTAYDYYRFCQMMLNNGELDGVRVLSRKTIELMTATNHIGDSDAAFLHSKGWKFGLGFAIEMDRGHEVDSGSVGAYEWAGIYSTRFSVDPKEEKITILMTQTFPFQFHVNLWERLLTISSSALIDQPGSNAKPELRKD
ncbi:MAG: beta-lactamase family protein, partial [Deltaproteobacteria bacterium]|nr:beta-lactamase family protein [Deltaproteobacteria bacterium]